MLCPCLPICLPPGYPWIDAAMRQLSEWGWMHHLARHSVACFLTRGDLYISWEAGKAVFEELLLDAVRRLTYVCLFGVDGAAALAASCTEAGEAALRSCCWAQ